MNGLTVPGGKKEVQVIHICLHTCKKLHHRTIAPKFLKLKLRCDSPMVAPQVILYSGEPLWHYVEMAYLNTCAKIYSIYFNDPVLQFSQTGYQTEDMSL